MRRPKLRPSSETLIDPESSQRQPPKSLEDARLRINFSSIPWKSTSWKDALQWLAKEADLSLVGDSFPSGTCSFRDTQVYTVPQSIDVLNGLLRSRGFILLHKDPMLIVRKLDDEVIPSESQQH